jgi:hypothetical protein
MGGEKGRTDRVGDIYGRMKSLRVLVTRLGASQ